MQRATRSPPPAWKPTDLDYILVATCTPDRFIPAMACHVQAKLGAVNAAATDTNAGCTGFIYGLNLANGLIATGSARRILLIGSERLTSYLDLERRDTAVLFGDGAGAVILEATEGSDGLESINVGSNGNLAGALTVEGAGSSWMDIPTPVRSSWTVARCSEMRSSEWRPPLNRHSTKRDGLSTMSTS